MEKLIGVICLMLVFGETIAQNPGRSNTVSISFDKHVIAVLEGMFINRPVDNTCGEKQVEDGVFDQYLYLDSLDLNHVRLQVGNVLSDNTFPKCNLSLFTNKGILSMELVFDNETPDLVRVFRESNLIYQYDVETQVATQAAILDQSVSSISRINHIYNATNEPDFSQTNSTPDLIDFTLTNIVFDDEKVFLFVVVKNSSTIDYEFGLQESPGTWGFSRGMNCS